LAAKVNKKELTDSLLGCLEHKEQHKEPEDLSIETTPSPVPATSATSK
jgi:hypothetical protein